MKFWRVKVLVEGDNDPKVFIVQGPYDKKRTKEILKDVHPEYQKITMRSIKRPKWCTAWSSK